MLVDVILAIAHFLFIFAILSALVYEMAVIRPGLTPSALRRVGLADIIYGVSAGLLVVVGFGRVQFGLKGADFYLGSTTFWIKIALFAMVFLLETVPMTTFIHARIARRRGATPPAIPVAAYRAINTIELLLVVTIVFCAALMARAVWMFE